MPHATKKNWTTNPIIKKVQNLILNLLQNSINEANRNILWMKSYTRIGFASKNWKIYINQNIEIIKIPYATESIKFDL